MVTNKFRRDTRGDERHPSKRHKSNHAGRDHVSAVYEHKLTVDEGLLIQQLQVVVDQVLNRSHMLNQLPRGAEILQASTQLQNILSVTNNQDSRRKKIKTTQKPDVQASSLPDLPWISDPCLERAVFTYPGAPTNPAKEEGEEHNYDRLEVLGDAYLEVIATRLIWERFPGMPAGRISQIREDLIKNETLAGFASQYQFDNRIMPSVPAEQRSQSKTWLKIRGDVFEAYVAAAILSDPEHGFDVVEKWLRELWTPRLSHIQPPPTTALRYKEQLARKVMSKGIKLRYVEEQPAKQLDGGMQTYYIGVYLTGWGWQDQHLGSGSGLNKAIAGDEAAKQALSNSPLIDEVSAAKTAHDQEASATKAVLDGDSQTTISTESVQEG